MKYSIGLLFLIAHTFGEAPAPYPASGWRPQGPAFELPSENNSRFTQTLPQVIPSTRYGVPQTPYPAPEPQRNVAPQNQNGAPAKQLIPQTQYGAPQKLPPLQLGAPQIPQSQQQTLQNQYGAPSTQPSNSIPQNQYGAPFQQTEIKLTPQQQQLLLNQLIKLQQILASQRRQQVAPQNEYGAPSSSVDVRSGGTSNPQNQYEAPSLVEPLNGDQNNPGGTQFVPNTQYLPSFTSAAFKPQPQPSFRSQNNDKRLSFSDDQNLFKSDRENQDDSGYKTIVLTRTEEDDYNKKYGTPIPSPPSVSDRRRKTQSIPEAPKTESDGEENFDDASGDPNISVANAFASGRYYLLLPDGRLQKVTYKTTQNDEEAKTNGFTANLMYQVVEPIKDPIYTIDGTPYVPVNQNSANL